MEYTTVSLPKPLVDKVKKLIRNTGFTSPSDFVSFVLREILVSEKRKSPFPARDEIKEQLKRLGYM